MTLELSTDLLLGLLIGGVVGLTVGLVIGIVSGLKKSKLAGDKNQAQKLFNSAMKEEDQKRRLRLLAQIVDKYPHSEWEEKALEQVMKLRKES